LDDNSHVLFRDTLLFAHSTSPPLPDRPSCLQDPTWTGAHQKSDAGQKDQECASASRSFARAEALRQEWKAESFRKAIKEYSLARSYWKACRDDDKELTTLLRLGDVHLTLGENARALEIYQEAEKRSRGTGNRLLTAESLNKEAWVLILLGRIADALENCRQLLEISRELGNSGIEAYAYLDNGEANYHTGDILGAIECYQRALSLWTGSSNPTAQAQTLRVLGSAYADLGRHREALDSYKKAQSLFTAAFHKHGQALTLSGLGQLYAYMGENQRALGFLEEANNRLSAIGDPVGLGMVLNGMAAIYADLGQQEAALDFYRKALRSYEKANVPKAVAGQLLMIGQIYLAADNATGALEYDKKALLIARSLGDHRVETNVLRSIGGVEQFLGQPDDAIQSFNQALSLARRHGDLLAEGAIFDDLGSFHESESRLSESLASYQQALQVNRVTGIPIDLLATLCHIARIQRRQGSFQDAMSTLKEALGIIESLRSGIEVPGLRISLLASTQRTFETYIDMLMQQYIGEGSGEAGALALLTSEKARARGLLDLLTESRGEIRRGISPELLASEQALLRSLNEKDLRRKQLLRGDHAQEEAERLSAEIRDLNLLYDRLLAKIKVESNQYATLTQPRPLELKEIQDQVLDGETLLLEYALGEERSYLWAVTWEGIAGYELPARERIESLARRVRELLTVRQRLDPKETASEMHRRATAADAQYRKAAAELSRMVLGPAAGRLGGRRLLIVADGLLQRLPFAALPVPGKVAGDSTPIPLIAEHEIVVLPSASTLSILRHEVAGRKPATKSIAVFADPVFERDDPRLRKPIPAKAPLPIQDSDDAGRFRFRALRGGVDFGRLLSSRREAEAILSVVPAGSGVMWAGLDANVERALSPSLADYRIVHFATHGVLDDKYPNLSGVVLSTMDGQARERNGFLRMPDIFNLNLPADLVVLSACNTALGKDVRGEGLIGLVRGFMYAGAARVVASLWAVDDESTAELMKSFYEKMLKEGMSPAAALRGAQMGMCKHNRWSAPYYWAGFVLQGEYR
jgi:CHAT domain-containing protein/Tfp pilus assembly protein PilF